MGLLKKIAAFFLLLIYSISATAAGELSKLPVLITHYHDHSTSNKKVGVTSFLAMHYFFDTEIGVGAGEHNRLPFKSADYYAGFSFISVTPPLSATALPARESNINQSFQMSSHKFLFYFQFLAAIWQPPRKAS